MRRALRRNVPTGAPETEKPAGCRIAFGNSTRGNDSSSVGTSCRTNETSSVGRRCLVLALSATDQSLSKSIRPPLANEQALLAAELTTSASPPTSGFASPLAAIRGLLPPSVG